MTKSSIANIKLDKMIFWIATAILALAFIAQHLSTAQPWLALLDNLHWTTGTAAAIMAWLGFSQATGTDRAARRWFFAGLAAYLAGQILWDIQVYIGWNPFPAPSDLGYILLGPGCLLGLVAAMRIQVPKHNRFVMALDAAMLCTAILALTLTLYLPNSANIDLLTLSVLTAYPVTLLTAACFGILLVLHLRPHPNWTWILFQIGLGLQGLIWMWWNFLALSNRIVDGSFLNELFSVASIILGVSAMRWHMVPSESARYKKWCEGLLRMLPLAVVITASLASVLAITRSDDVPALQDAVLLSAFAVIVLAAIRQSLILREHAQLLEAETAVAESRALLQTVIDTAPVRVFWKNRDLHFLGCNAAFASDAGMEKPEDLIGKDDYQMAWKDQADFYRSDDFAVINSGGPKLSYDEPQTTPDGHQIWLRTSKVPLRNKRNEIIGVLGVYSDITERKQAEESLRISATAFDTHDAIMVTDADAKILRVNRAFQKVTGYSEQEVIGRNPRMFQSGRHDAAFYQDMWDALHNAGKWSGEVWDKRKNGEIYPKYMTITTVYDAHHKATNYVAIFSDITQRKQSEEEIHQLAFYDTLTKLPNRRLLMDRLHLAHSSSARSKRYGALLLLDIDRFKTLNDTLGHDQGDLMLIEIADRLRARVREIDTVARLGGDEFVILLEDLSEDMEDASQKAAHIADKIREDLKRPFKLSKGDYHSSTSIGVCLYYDNTETSEDLIKHSDMAMYQAKGTGGNAVRFFDPSMQQVVENRAKLEADLRQAILNQQLILYYQMQLDNDHRVLGAEALVRWRHPERGMVSPAQFIPVAEESSLILDIGNWVLETACHQLAAWSKNEQTLNLIVAVNVSAAQFKSIDFVDKVAAVIQAHNIDPSRLKLELTESVVLDDVAKVVAKMHALKGLGIGLSLDDFGTGYSSLSYLKQLPLDQLKIDQSFVRNVTVDPCDEVMVKTIIDLGRNFQLNVIAEGVETDTQFSFLKLHGCMAYQGYLFSKPVPIEEFEKLILKN